MHIVSLVGAGPGDPELLTFAAARAIQAAEVILFDDLVSADIMALAPPAARLINVGKRGYRLSCKQIEINDLIVSWALAGFNVVRLKGGDPLIFGRAAEEIEACAAAGIEVKVIPGITSAQAAAASLRIPLTHRTYARRLQFITGHDRKGVLPDELNWRAVADPHVTTVVYMPLRTLRQLTEKVIALGLPPGTPAVAIANVSRAGETVLRATVADIADAIERDPPGTPAVVLIGAALGIKQSSGV